MIGSLVMLRTLLASVIRGGASYRRWRWETAFGHKPPPLGEMLHGLVRYAIWVGQMRRFR